MARACLGDVIDLHSGGEDNLFPHHECETAQSAAALGVHVASPDGAGEVENFCRYWVHGRHLLVNGAKMSKRDGTFFTVKDLLDPAASGRQDLVEPLTRLGFPSGKVPAVVLRLALLSCSYTLPMNFTLDSLVQARATVQRLQTRYERLREQAEHDPEARAETPSVRAAIDSFEKAFDAALDDNLEVSKALAAVHAFVSELNQLELDGPSARLALRTIERFDLIFDVLERRGRSFVVTRERMERFRESDFLRERGQVLASWREHSERGGLWSALDAGRLPEDAALARVTELDPDVTELFLAIRHQSRKDKQFERADRLRLQLAALGAQCEDTPGGVRFKL
jgi:cysteinyl-tRNA synthetase